MRPSSRLYLDPNVIYQDRRARQRARWLFDYVNRDVQSARELIEWDDSGPVGKAKVKPFPKWWLRDCESSGELDKDAELRMVTEVADSYPRLVAWLTEGRVSRYWNVFGTLVWALRSCLFTRWVVWRLVFMPIARHAPWRFALHELILQQRRYELNEQPRFSQPHGQLITGDCTRGLSAVTDVAMIAPTASRVELRAKVERMSSGCIGVSGLPGVGKTALIREFCGHRYGTPRWARSNVTEMPGLRLTVKAPLRYDPREFLIHLYTCLCQAVLADPRLNPTSFFHRIILSLAVPRSIRTFAFLRGLMAIVLLAAAGSLAYRAIQGSWPWYAWMPQAAEWLGVGIAFAVFMLLVTGPTRRALVEVRQVVTVATDAQSRLERLHFQRTDTRSYGGTIGGPRGTGLNASSTRSFTEQMMTLPELIDDYRDFVERVVAALQQVIIASRNQAQPSRASKENFEIRLVIGIDEMDRIEDIRDADKFLAELSSVFGNPHSVYLISVSPGTLATGNQRIVPLKTASNGIFDDMVWVEPLDLPTAQNLLDHRVIGLPVAFIALCHVVSGGLPKDLLRIARTIYTIKGSPEGHLGLAGAAASVIADELRALIHRAMAHITSLDIPAAPELLGLLSAHDRPIRDAENSGPSIDITALMTDLSLLWAGAEREKFIKSRREVDPLTAEVCDSFLAGLYFLLTVHQLFAVEPDIVTGLAMPENTDGARGHAGNGVLHGLARARTTLGINPYLAAEMVHDARKTLAHRSGHLDLFAEVKPAFLANQPEVSLITRS